MSTQPSPLPAERLANLTRDDARARAAAVSDVEYDIHLTFARDAQGYSGRARVRFTCAKAGQPVFLDFVGREIVALELNGAPVDGGAYQGPRIVLPPARVLAGANEVAVQYACSYDHDSVGLHHFKDTTDGTEYLYTDFEPYDANRVFPAFDQPDLKAVFRITVTAPAGWQVISNTLETRRTPDGERETWEFAPTARISTYLMNVSAGDFQVWTDAQARVPSRIFARKSLAQHVDADALFEVTRKGFDFYEKYFEVPYAFGKYDQIFVPEFKTGAMENVGAVVVTDNVLFRHKPTAEESVDRAILLLHEMAHMWFGNLVTMRWWDGLWLNESFATYMSFIAAEAVTDYREIWQFFDARLRRWAVWQDELSTTHPIDMDVAETAGCFNNFDGITYGKGCCVLKQLAFRLGAESFREGVAAYLTRYSWKNTENQDFIRALSDAAKTDLSSWEKVWLHSSGVNTLSCELKVVGGKIGSLSVRQSSGNGDARVKEHRLKLGLFEEASGGFVLSRALDVTITGESAAVPAAVGLPAPAFLLPNHETEAYAKIMLDPMSLACVESKFPRFTDAALRSSVIDILRIMLQDAHLSTQRYLAIVMSILPTEPSSQILDGLTRSVLPCIAQYLDGQRRGAFADRLHAAALAQLESGTHAPAMLRLWFRYLVGSTFGEAARARLTGLLGGTVTLGNLELDQDMRWDLVSQLVRTGTPRDILAAEEKRDATDRGVRRAFAIQAALPDAANKQVVWDRFLTDRTTSLVLLKAGFQGFHQPDQEAMLAPFAARYLEALPAVARDRSMEFAMAFAEALFPSLHDNAEFIFKVNEMIRAGALPPALTRIVKERRDDLVRLAKIRALARD